MYKHQSMNRSNLPNTFFHKERHKLSARLTARWYRKKINKWKGS